MTVNGLNSLRSICFSLLLAMATLVVTQGRSFAADPIDDAVYQHKIKPLLEKRCFACHGALKQESSLRVDSAESLFRGGDIGPAVVPGQLDESWLYQTITGEAGFLMPPEGEPLANDEIALIKSWIEAGAPVPEDDHPEADPQDHWAFQPIVQPPLPAVTNGEWAQSPVDFFIAAQHEERGLTPAPPAEKAILLRRVYLDLVGLPPTPEELHAFLSDNRPEAYQEVVDKLLDSPQYGERWGRHWMDVWRYSDWYGRRSVSDMTNSYSTIWRWRDWIISSLNNDKGYDQMVREMLAADELYPEDRESHVATGFIVRNYYRWNYHTWLKDNVEHTGKAFLGLTFNCCECHDHKYDPIGQNEYFAMRAFFEPLDLRHNRVPRETDPGPFPDYELSVLNPPIRTGQVQIYDRYPEKETKLYTGGVETNIVADKPPVDAGGPAFLSGNELDIAAVDLPVTAWYPGLQPFVIEEETIKRSDMVKQAYHVWKTEEPSLLEKISSLESQLRELKQQSLPALSDEDALASTSNQQALQLAAESGRRTLQHGMPQPVPFDDQTELRFRIKLIKDGLANFQLSQDLAAGRTNLYIVFTNGEIQAYIPGQGTVPQTIGSYGQLDQPRNFEAQLRFQPENDQALLTLSDLDFGASILSDTAISLHGWKPSNSANCGIFLDVHPNTIAEFDDIVFQQRDEAEPTLTVDFEFPLYLPGSDPSGAANWQVSRFSTGDGHSEVILLGELTPEQTQLREQISNLTKELAGPTLRLEELTTRHAAAESELAAYRATVEAEHTRYARTGVSAEEIEKQVAEASRLRREANHQKSVADKNAAAYAVHVAQQLPADQQDRAKQIEDAEKSLATAQQTLVTTEKAITDATAEYEPLSRQFPKQSTGKRAALAKWITDPANPLPARVAVNHLWGRHFGQPLVKTTYDFGRNGAKPTHPELLDWLAAELQQNNWSFKHLHRLIVTSQTYQQSSSTKEANAENKTLDQDNRSLWHYPGHRLEAEVIRDSLLQVSGELDTTFYGQEIEHEEGATSGRRSVYLSHHGEGKLPFLEMFDVADPCDCYVRKTSVMPQQALALANSDLALRLSQKLAARLWEQQSDETANNADFVRAAFERILSRPATDAELTASVTFLERQQALLENGTGEVTSDEKSLLPDEPAERARQNLIQALFNHSDFITVR
ncbi:MAG: hypothetical protein CMJ46_14955 [Planctomyces sp.]|nr:hypothetical protein [Planctomyces sp.]